MPSPCIYSGTDSKLLTRGDLRDGGNNPFPKIAEMSYCKEPSSYVAATTLGWNVSAGTATISTSTLPRLNSTKQAILYTSVATNDYIRYRFLIDDVDKSRAFKVQFATICTTLEYEIEVWSGTDSALSSPTQIALSTDSAGVSAITGGTREFTTLFTTSSRSYYEVRWKAKGATKDIKISDVTIGPGPVLSATILTNPMTTTGDVIVAGASGTPARLAIGTEGKALRAISGTPAWAWQRTTVAKSADFVIGDTDGYETHLVTTGSGADVTASLPAAANNTGRQLTIKKVDTGTKNVIVARAGSDTIDGAITNVLHQQYSTITVVSDGTNWHVVSVYDSVSATVLTASQVSLTTSTAADITSILLSAGTWDITGYCTLNGSATTGTRRILGIGTTTATSPGADAGQYDSGAAYNLNTVNEYMSTLRSVTITSATTYYLVVTAVFSGGGNTARASGKIRAVRVGP